MKILLKHGAALALVIAFPLLVAGCLDLTRTISAMDIPRSTKGEIIVTAGKNAVEVAGKVPIPRGKADNLVKEFAAALNAEDAAKVLCCMTLSDDDYYPIEWAKAALENYNVYFSGEKIERIELMGTHGYRQALIYRLYTPTDNYKEICVNAHYLDGKHLYDELFIYDSLLYYSYRAKLYLDEFVNAICQNKPKTIATLLTYDDIDNPYPESKAMEIIRNYETHFELQTLHYAFIGTETKETDSGNLVYVIRGKKGNVPAEHEIRVSYGDGLVGLRDKWIPPKD